MLLAERLLDTEIACPSLHDTSEANQWQLMDPYITRVSAGEMNFGHRRRQATKTKKATWRMCHTRQYSGERATPKEVPMRQAFPNSLTLDVYDPALDRVIGVRLWERGAVHITGIRTLEDCTRALTLICSILRIYVLPTSTWVLQDLRLCMTNARTVIRTMPLVRLAIELYAQDWLALHASTPDKHQYTHSVFFEPEFFPGLYIRVRRKCSCAEHPIVRRRFKCDCVDGTIMVHKSGDVLIYGCISGLDAQWCFDRFWAESVANGHMDVLIGCQLPRVHPP